MHSHFLVFLDQEMGNSVSAAAQSMASNMAPGTAEKENIKPANHAHYQQSNGNPPPECPMHQKVPPAPPKAAASECPVKHDNSDVSPLNMVSILRSV